MQTTNYEELIGQIGLLLQEGRMKAAQQVNTILVLTYWEIGRHIVEYEQNGKEKAEYGSKLFDRLSKDLTSNYGKGFGRSNLIYIRKLYITFPISGTLSHQLTWSHYYEILKTDSELERNFYIKQTEKERWSVRELKRQIRSSLFQRLAIGTDKKGILKLSKEGHDIQEPQDLIKDPFVLEFLDIQENHNYFESDIEDKLISHLQKFLLELGKGFAFIGRQYRMSIGGKHLSLRPSILSSYCEVLCLNRFKTRRNRPPRYIPDKKKLQKLLRNVLDV